MCPTPPTPITAAVDPGARRGRSLLTAWYAVIPASECGATAAGSTPGGSGISERSSTSTYSAKPPSRVRPVNWCRSQCMSSPRRHGTQSPQLYGG